MWEEQSDKKFVSLSSLALNVDYYKLLFNEFELSSLTVEDLQVHIIQDGQLFNFSDLIAEDDDTAAESENRLAIKISNISIKNADFNYRDLL